MVETKDHRATYAHSASHVIQQLDDDLRANRPLHVRSVATGFDILDEVLSGGLHAGDLVLLGGPPGVGKTIASLQWARNVARDGQLAVFACYEHEPNTLLLRLLALEAGELGGDASIAPALERALVQGQLDGQSLRDVLAGARHGQQALQRVEAYADNLILVRASGASTTLSALRSLIEPHVGTDRATVLFVDYLQKVPLQPEPDSEAEKVTRTVEGLKDLALDLSVPIVLLSAVDAEGMRANRLRLYHLRGSSAIAFESDVVLMLNEKAKAVSKVYLSYDIKAARSFKDWVVMSVEKNRGGPNLVDLEFRKDFAHFRFDPDGGIVTEKLVDERLDEDSL